MEVLLVGSGRMAEAVIERLNKSGNRVYLLTGRRQNIKLRQRVFAKYNFSYEDESVKDIFDSVKPDITIFLGAWDSNFNWHKARNEAVRYTASLINVLAAYAMLGKGRFIYFSSQDVYSGSSAQNISESQQPFPVGFRSMAIAQGENICSNYRVSQGLQVCTLRFDHLYWVPKKGRPEDDPCGSMCMEALRSGRISANKQDAFSMLFIKDAVELAYKIIAAPEPEQTLYNISSMEEIDGIELAELVCDALGGGIELVDNTVGEHHRIILDGRVYAKEFGQKILTTYENGVAQVARYMQRNRESFIRAEDAGGNFWGRLRHRVKLLGETLIPYAENIAVFVLFFFIKRAAAGSGFSERLDFALLYVLLFAIIHGQKQAILSSILAVFGTCIQEMYTRSGVAVLLDYNIYVWIAQLFIVGMIVGYLKDQLYIIRQERQDEVEYLETRLNDIIEINDSNVRMMENFEAQLINQKDSLGKIYNITSTLEQQAPEEVLFTAVQMISRLMECEGAAVYTVANRDYARLFSATSEEARSLGNSIEYTAMADMYDKLKEHRVYINKNMDEKLPLMASAVYNDNEIALIFMLWGIPWQRMTLAEANRLAVIGRMVQSAVLRAAQYLDTLRNERFVEGSRLMKKEAFTQLTTAFFRAQDQGLTECSLLRVDVPNGDYVNAADILSKNTRQSDYMGDAHDGFIYVLLSNTSKENAAFVVDRFDASGYKSCLVGGTIQ